MGRRRSRRRCGRHDFNSGLVAAFGEEVVKSGKIAPEQGRALARVLKTRLLADYSADSPDIDEATETVALAEAFLAAVGARFTSDSFA